MIRFSCAPLQPVCLLMSSSPASAAFWGHQMNCRTIRQWRRKETRGTLSEPVWKGRGASRLKGGRRRRMDRSEINLYFPLSWWGNYVPNYGLNQWAPDVQYFNGKYWLYYAVSSFGKNTSAIGLASSTSLSSGNWKDEGLVIRSTSADNYNAIDPELTIDKDGNPWLAFGSFGAALS